MARSLTPKEFAAECEKRLMDAHEVMTYFGLRSRQTVWYRVSRGLLPEPILTRANAVSLWDRATLPTRKER